MDINEKVKHVFVLMLENHSFDNIFAMSGIPGLHVATGRNSNSYNGITYNVAGNAPSNMPTDPGHEFLDVVEQLCGTAAKTNYQCGEAYPAINNEGFASNYATSDSEKTGLPGTGEIGDIMKCFDTETELPVIHQLATEFAVCDHWHSSLPGPTWPNRFFLHGGSSAGLDHSPKNGQIAGWEADPFSHGFEYQHGSVYDRLGRHNWALYHDASLTAGGQIPQVASIRHIHQWDVHHVSKLYHELKHAHHHGYKPKYTFIEPNYGDVYRTYKGGSSQHPMDGVAEGERLIKEVYEAIRSSSIWEESLLIITYDEHGGFYDSVAPPPAIPPGDKTMIDGSNEYGFNFDRYGVRVPAVIVSPFIPKGTVSHTIYDHTSVIATLSKIFGIDPLTNRDAAANTVDPLLSLSNARTDCPIVLNNPAYPQSGEPTLSPEEEAIFDLQPLPESGNLIGFLYILLKSKLELSGGTEKEQAEIIDEFKNIKTRGNARAYGHQILARVEVKRAETHKH